MKSFFKAVLFIATLAMGNAHALCVNPDGNLDGDIVYNAPIDMLPLCSAEPVKKVAIAVAAAPAAKQAKAKAAEQAGVPIPYLVGDDAE